MIDATRHGIDVATGLLADQVNPRVIAWRADGAWAHVADAFRAVARTEPRLVTLGLRTARDDSMCGRRQTARRSHADAKTRAMARTRLRADV